MLIFSVVIGDISRPNRNWSMADSKGDCVEIMEVDNCESKPSTSKEVTSSQPTEVKKSQRNLPW